MKLKKTILLPLFIGILSISTISQISANYGEVKTIAVVPGMDPNFFPAAMHNPEWQAAFLRAYHDYGERVISFWTVPGPYDSQEALGYSIGFYITAENQQEAMQARDEMDIFFYIQKDGENSWALLCEDKTPVVRMPELTKLVHEWGMLPDNVEIYSFRAGGAFKPDTLTPGWYTLRIIFYYLGAYDEHVDLVFEIY
ncbi:MAG: hypothetical protein ACFFAJ_16255 [Candidatus Hodarchaeota archaeon]